MYRYLAGLTVVFAACVGAQTIALRASGGKTLKSESNYFSSIARLQTEATGQPDVLLLGSSMTGRLGDRAEQVEGVGNLGCDGGSAVVTLRAMDRGILPAAPLLVVEANTLSFELEQRGKEIGRAMDSAWFQAGIKTPNIGATARPTAFAYSWLMGKMQKSTVGSSEPLTIASKPGTIPSGVETDLDEKEAALVEEVRGIFERLEKKGSKILMVVIPPASEKHSAQSRIPRAIAARSGVLFWDMTEGLLSGSVSFSDGLHLDGPSAQKVMLALTAELRSLQNSPPEK